MSQWRDGKFGRFTNAKKNYRAWLRLERLKKELREKLEAEGYAVYSAGWPQISAEKDGKMRFFVLNPIVTDIPVVLGKKRDLLSEAFKRCFGVEFEIWADAKEERGDISGWV